jgi:amino acid permease
VPLCWVRKIKYFAFTSLLGIVTVIFTVTAVSVHGIEHATPPDPFPLFPSGRKRFIFIYYYFIYFCLDLFLFLGVAAFGYAAIATSATIENTMAKPEHFMKCITGTFTIISIVYIGFGMGVFYLYGTNVQAVISCVVDGPLGISIKTALIIQVIFFFFIYFFLICFSLCLRFRSMPHPFGPQ